jgi:hypothetical protein
MFGVEGNCEKRRCTICSLLGHIFLYLGSSIADDRLCGLVVRVLGYRSGGPGWIPGTTRFSEKKKKKVNSSGPGTGSTQPREYNWGATW